jgi:hypothetical protein
VNIDGGCVWEENERRCVVIIPPSIITRYASLVNSDGWRPRCFYGVFTGAEPPIGLLERSCAVGGRYPRL